MPIRKKSFSTETIIAIAATVTSVCALIVAIYQTKLSREQQLNSVWPYLVINESIDENQKSTIMITNHGVGPAIIDSVRVVYKGKSYRLPTQVISEISRQLNRGEHGMSWSHIGLGKGAVISQGQSLPWITLNDSSDNMIFRRELPQIKTYVYYHSMYGERWHSVFHDGSEMVVTD